MKESDRLATVADIAEQFQISARGVWRLLRAGQFPEPIRIGRCVRWRREDIADYLSGLAAGNKEESP